MENTIAAREPSKGIVIAAFIALYIIWGSTYLGNLLAIKSFPPFIMAGIRFTTAGLLLYGWCLLKGQKTPPLNSISKIALSGILMLFIGTGAVVWVEQYLPSGLTAIIVAAVPLWFVALDKREWKTYFSNKMIIVGLLVGFAGVLLLFADKSAANIAADKRKLISFFILVAGSICWATGSLYSKYQTVEGTTSMKAALQMTAAGVASFVFAFVINEQQDMVWQQVSRTSIGAVLYLIFMGSLVGYISYIFLLSVRPASLVGTYAYVNPVVAVFLGWLVVGEKIGLQQFIALGAIVAGVVMVNIFRNKKTPVQKKTYQMAESE